MGVLGFLGAPPPPPITFSVRAYGSNLNCCLAMTAFGTPCEYAGIKRHEATASLEISTNSCGARDLERILETVPSGSTVNSTVTIPYTPRFRSSVGNVGRLDFTSLGQESTFGYSGDSALSSRGAEAACSAETDFVPAASSAKLWDVGVKHALTPSAAKTIGRYFMMTLEKLRPQTSHRMAGSVIWRPALFCGEFKAQVAGALGRVL